jgi:hypothetical protein
MRRETGQLARQAVSEGPPRLRVGQQSIRGPCTTDGEGARRDATRLSRRFDRSMNNLPPTFSLLLIRTFRPVIRRRKDRQAAQGRGP